ncbi:MAG: hypothetical protein PVF73_07400 [Bacteroidales bacterium]|jgi:hypothetical protein
MIPSIKHKKWLELLLSPDIPEIRNHSMRLKLNAVKRKIKTGRITPEEGAKEFFNECNNHYELYRSDLLRIFND